MWNLWTTARNVIAETEKVGYDPSTGTNWCHLPMEMRLMCIEWMNFMTRDGLSRTSKTEKSLVEATKYSFALLQINSVWENVNVMAENELYWFLREKVRPGYLDSRENKVKFAVRILKECHVEEIELDGVGRLKDSLLSALRQCAPFRIRKFTTNCLDSQALELFLTNSEHLKTITFTRKISQNEDLDEALDFPSVVNIRELRISKLETLNSVWKLISKWIEMDAEIGKSLQFVIERMYVVELFARKFSDRLIHYTENTAIIQTNNETKHILMRNVGTRFSNDDYTSCKVIPVDLPESENRKGDRWIEMLFDRVEGHRIYQKDHFAYLHRRV